MRHYEDYEMEHLRNGTGSLVLRLRCAKHIKQCELCRTRYGEMMANEEFLDTVRRRMANIGNMKNDGGKAE